MTSPGHLGEPFCGRTGEDSTGRPCYFQICNRSRGRIPSGSPWHWVVAADPQSRISRGAGALRAFPGPQLAPVPRPRHAVGPAWSGETSIRWLHRGRRDGGGPWIQVVEPSPLRGDTFRSSRRGCSWRLQQSTEFWTTRGIFLELQILKELQYDTECLGAISFLINTG